MRQFNTGATRDKDEDKLDYDGFLSPAVLKRFAEYMHQNRRQADGKLRGSDNWKLGMPREAYMKSLWRHFMDVWMNHSNTKCAVPIEEALCAVMFNAMGMLHEILNESEIERCIREQTRCSEAANNHRNSASERQGAAVGVADWVTEEAILRSAKGQYVLPGPIAAHSNGSGVSANSDAA